MELYRDLIKENISYEILRQDMPYDCDRLDEIVELMVETVCSTRSRSVSPAATTLPRW